MDAVSTLLQLGAVITALTTITLVLKKQLTKDVKDLGNIIKEIDYNNCKTYLTDFLSDVRSGEPKSDIQRQRACEIYTHYIQDLKGNTYIKTEWEKLVK